MRMFIPGRQLSEQFYWQAVRPQLNTHFPELQHAAALIDSGSEVLGFDDDLSTDHHWGPRVLLFLSETDHTSYAERVQTMLAHELPYEFMGYSTNFTPPLIEEGVTQLLQAITEGPINHRVTLQTVRGFVQGYLNYDMTQPLEVADWLTFPEQKLRTLTQGPVFYDGIGLEAGRGRFTYYPDDVWLYQLAAAWTRISQEEHLMGRAGLAGDELGSAIIGARLVRDVMRLWFLMHRTYAPYPKWFGTAFKQLPDAENLAPLLQQVFQAETWPEREAYLVPAYEMLACQHNKLGLTGPVTTQVTTFFNRPFRVITFNGVVGALEGQIQDERVKRLLARPRIGGIDLFSDSTDLLAYEEWRPQLRSLFI
ncbi:MAG: DUF4037 domain-containing protein [Chloroflexi bacterium]|nr:DUF4037 domain-containing protein [Chloroflexota bacterium]